jgi:hypothetical protein
MSDVTSTRTITSCSLIITTNRTSSDTRSSSFVVASQNESIPSPSQRVRLHHQAGLAIYPDDYSDKVFFRYNLMGYSDDEGDGKGGPPPRALLCLWNASTSTSTSELRQRKQLWSKSPSRNARRSSVDHDTKPRETETFAKSFRRECSRPEV